MLGDSSSVLATTTTTSGTGGAGGGEGGNGNSSSNSEVVRQLLTGAHEGSSSTEVGHGHHVIIGSTGEEDRGTGGGDIDGDRSFGGNRWPRQETLALLKIRSDMDVDFRDASVKGPLWEEVSRKLAELGYNRSAKKCKEKFENVYKYHKRTKEGRTGKREGKTYRFFDQLEAFKNHPSALPSPSSTPSPPKPQPPVATIKSMPAPPPNPPPEPRSVVASHNTATVPSTAATIASTTMTLGVVTSSINITIPSFPSTNPTVLPSISQAINPTNPSQPNLLSSFPNFSPDLISNSTSSSTSSDLELQGQRRRKRKWKDLFGRLMNEVIQRQEEMQKKFLEAIEKREHERMVREESWRMQEMERINREREILAQERSIAAAKDAAVMAFLQKLSEQQNPAGQALSPPVPPPPQSQPLVQPQQPPPAQVPAAPPPQQAAAPALPPMPVSQVPPPQPAANMEIVKLDNNGDQNFMPTNSSRWPKVEVQALISLRTNLDSKYQETGPKGPLWEEVSGGMRRLGYNRNAKRCKEKWENINKYFKKVKESDKKRPEHSKTCPYFHQLDALYKEKNKKDGSSITYHHHHHHHQQPKPENSIPLMVRPEQQWPPPQQGDGEDSVMEDLESEDTQNHHQEEEDMDNEEEEEEDEASGCQVVASKAATMSTDE